MITVAIGINDDYSYYSIHVRLFPVRSSDKRIAHDGELSDSEDEGDDRKNISSKEDGPQKKRAKFTPPVPKIAGEDKVEKKSDDKKTEDDVEKKPELKKKENGPEIPLTSEVETKPAPRFVALFPVYFGQGDHSRSA